MNLEAMSLILAEGKQTKIVSQVIEDITKMNQILSGHGKNWVQKAESEREIVYLLLNSYDVNYFLDELLENLGMEDKLGIFESEPLVSKIKDLLKFGLGANHEEVQCSYFHEFTASKHIQTG